jgi:hypothetical protein
MNDVHSDLTSDDGEEETYDPTSWVMKWPHKEISIVDAWTKVHARFGIVAKQASELETGLQMLVAQGRQWKKGNPEFEALLQELRTSADPLGALIKNFMTLYAIPKDSDLAKGFMLALNNRNYLIHHFYRDQEDKFTTPQGCEEHGLLMKIYDDFDATIQNLKSWGNSVFGFRNDDDILDEINIDAKKWKTEYQLKLAAMLGRVNRPKRDVT